MTWREFLNGTPFLFVRVQQRGQESELCVLFIRRIIGAVCWRGGIDSLPDGFARFQVADGQCFAAIAARGTRQRQQAAVAVRAGAEVGRGGIFAGQWRAATLASGRRFVARSVAVFAGL